MGASNLTMGGQKHFREGCIRRTRDNSVGRGDVEIFVRPMRYKGCRQAHKAQVVTCALFATRNSLKLQGRRHRAFGGTKRGESGDFSNARSNYQSKSRWLCF